MTTLWECTSGGGTGQFAGYTFGNREDLWNGVFDTNGKPKLWTTPPSLKKGINPKKKKQPPLADIGWLTPGAIILNEKAHAALGGFLTQFGELLPVSCDTGPVYFYNVTNLVSCIDFDNSVKNETGDAIYEARFIEAAIPQGPQIFKDPLTATGRIYVTQAAREILDNLIMANTLTGLYYFPAGKRF